MLNLTCSIPRDVCLEILQDRKFYQNLEQILQILNTSPTGSDQSCTSESQEVAINPPPAKKRKLDPNSVVRSVNPSSNENFMWVLLQAACRCLDLLGSSERSEETQLHHLTSSWNSSSDERASLFGVLLEASASVADTSPAPDQFNVLASLITTVITFWTTGSANSRSHTDGQNRAFSSQCLAPTLTLLEILQNREADVTTVRPLIRALERLIAVHVVLPGRAIFIERYARKWKAIDDILFYDNLKSFLNDFQKTIIDLASTKIRMQKSKVAIAKMSLLRTIFDIAARAIPSSDLQKRQSEQPWLDILFLSLVHTMWEEMPRISIPGVEKPAGLSDSSSASYQSAVAAVESLVDISLARKIRPSLPVLGYTISALLLLDDQPPAWSLLAKLVQLDVNILISNTGLSTSADILNRICGRIEDTSVSDDVYSRILSDIILPVMRGFARVRNIDGFIQIWQDGLQNAIRQRYSSQAEPRNIPTVLVWDDDDVFDEFKALIEVYAPPSLGQRLLEQTLRPLEDLSTKVGSTAVEFSNLAIITAFLNASSTHSETQPFSDNQHLALFQAALAGLQRQSDFQAQRWRLWRLLRTLLQNNHGKNMLNNLTNLLQSDGGIVSLRALSLDKDVNRTHVRAAKYLEALECFSIVVEAASSATNFQSTLHEEIKHLAELVRYCSEPGGPTEHQNRVTEWDGRCYSCDDVSKLVTACIGRLLENPEIFLLDAKIFTELVSQALTFLGRSSAVQAEAQLSLGALLQVLLRLDEVMNNPTLRDLISTHLIESHSSPTNTNANNHLLLRTFPIQTLKKAQIKRFATDILTALSNSDISAKSDYINDRLATILYLDTHAPGSAVGAQDWRLWVKTSQKLAAIPKVMSSSYFVTTNISLRILRRVWSRAFAAQNSSMLSEISSWTTDSIKSCKRLQYFESPSLSLQAFFAQAAESEDLLESYLSKKKVQKLRAKFMQMLKRGLEDALGAKLGGSLVEVRLILHALLDICDPTTDQGVLHEISGLQEMIIKLQGASSNEANLLDSRLQLSIQRAYQQISSSAMVELEKAAIKTRLETLASRFRKAENCSTGEIGVFATELELTVRKFSPKTMALVLEYFRTDNSKNLPPILAPIATAVVTTQVDSTQMVQHPLLAKEVAAIACGFPGRGNSKASTLLSLDNCKYVLEFHPSLVNQSTLDRLLAAVCALTASSNKLFDDDADRALVPDASDIYSRICEVLGVVLGRHRRRISDRYHLLVPAMSNLLRCLFWPGTNIMHSLSGRDVAHSINAFGKALPYWLTTSEEALSPTSAELLSRLLSSICNPTVSAARTSRKRKHNELNDETKRARRLAGQHMFSLIMEYARCSLDGQIDPSVKEHLLPGLFSVMDAIERDLMKALNAGMDPSSRAIFKQLYDSWTAHGRWDKG